MLLDDTGDPGLRTLEMMAVEAIGAAGKAALWPIIAAP